MSFLYANEIVFKICMRCNLLVKYEGFLSTYNIQSKEQNKFIK